RRGCVRGGERLRIGDRRCLGRNGRRDNRRYTVMAARSIKTENMKFSMLGVLTSWKTCNAHVDQIAAVFSLNKNNRQFERQLSRVQMAKTGDREILPSFSQLDFSQLK